jgi:hypothetical protein
LAAIWSNLLGIERIGRNDHFFELGGHSLLVTHMIAQLRSAGWRLDVQSLFIRPVLSDLASSAQQELENIQI